MSRPPTEAKPTPSAEEVQPKDPLLGFRDFVRKALVIVFSLYAVALTCSMAAMEIGSWLTAFLTIIYVVLDRFSSKPEIKLSRTGYGAFILGFVAIASLGVFINAPKANWIKDLGALRDFVLFFFFFYSLKVFKSAKALALIIFSCASIIAIYGIWQHFTGIDIWRHDHRALMQIDWGSGKYFSTVGFFNHHLTYAYSFGMIACIGWAIFLTLKLNKTWQKAALTLGLGLILGSIFCTYARGAWIAMAVTLPLMALFVNKKYFIAMILALALAGGVLYTADQSYTARFNSVVSQNYGSNWLREMLWKVNWQMFKDHPIVGVGYLENEPLSTPYFQKMNIIGAMAGHAHSNYFEFLSTTGAPGFVAYMVLIFLPMILSVRLFFKLRREGATAAWDQCLVLTALGAQLVFHLGGLTQCTVCDSKVLHQFVFWLTVLYFINDKYKSTGNRRLA